MEVGNKLVLRGYYTRRFAMTIFGTTQGCNIVAILFRKVTTLCQHCNAVLRQNRCCELSRVISPLRGWGRQLVDKGQLFFKLLVTANEQYRQQIYSWTWIQKATLVLYFANLNLQVENIISSPSLEYVNYVQFKPQVYRLVQCWSAC